MKQLYQGPNSYCSIQARHSAEPGHCSSRALKPFACSCYVCFVCYASIAVLFSSRNLSPKRLFGNPKRFSTQNLLVRSVSSNQIANFGRNCSLSTASPTTSSTSAILRESAEKSPRFAYAIILILPPRASQTRLHKSHA